MERIKAAQLKVERAKKHIREFDGARAAFLGTNPYAVTPEYYIEKNLTVYFLDRWEPVPEDTVLLPYGDAVHILRSALDYLWWQLVEVCSGATPDPKQRPTFPIFKDLQSFEKYVSEPKREVEVVVKRIKDVLRRTQPYRGGNDTLWGLNQLDYIDKHRFLITAATGVSHFGIEVGGKTLERFFPGNVRLSHELPQRIACFHPSHSDLLGMKKGDPIFCLAGNFDANQDVQLTFDIALTEPEVFKRKPLLETLFAATKVVENLITDFTPFLL